MKKIIITTLLFLTIFTIPVMANSDKDIEDSKGYKKFEAEVLEIVNNDKNQEVLVETENNKIFLYIDKNKVLDLSNGDFNKEHEFKVGEKILFFIKENSPVYLSEPPKISAPIIATNYIKGNFSIDVDYFEKDGKGVSKRLVINDLKESKVVDINGTEIDKDKALGNDLIVLYTISTRSIPPQTVPEKVILIGDNKVRLPEKAIVIDDKEVYPIRNYYEELGAEVNWNSETKLITITLGNKKVEINTIDKNLLIDGNKTAMDFFQITKGVSYSSLKVFEDINNYFFN